MPDPTDYEGPNRWVFPTEDNYFVQDMVRRIAGIGIAEDLGEGVEDGGAKGAHVLKRRCGLCHRAKAMPSMQEHGMHDCCFIPTVVGSLSPVSVRPMHNWSWGV